VKPGVDKGRRLRSFKAKEASMTKTVTKLPVTTEKAGKEPVGFFTPLENLRREVDRLFESFQPGMWRFPFGRRPFEFDIGFPREMGFGVALAVDVAETDKAYEVTAEVPGLDEKDIEIKLANGMLTIKGEKSEEKEEREKDYYLSERRYGSFMRTMQVPEGVDQDKIEASLSKGVLKVVLPKTAEAQKSEKKIEVKAA
jgi:HSP20 family protein